MVPTICTKEIAPRKSSLLKSRATNHPERLQPNHVAMVVWIKSGFNARHRKASTRVYCGTTHDRTLLSPKKMKKKKCAEDAADAANQAAIAGRGTLLAAHGYCRPATSTATRRLQAWTRHRRGRRRRRRAAPRAWTWHPPDHHARDGQGRWRRP